MSAARASEWDASAYHRVSGPQQAWAVEQFERLALAPGESVLDAGCGSGKVTAQLAEMAAGGKVYGVDASANMAAHAQAELGDRATILCQDLTELELPEQVDAIFSNATFHWIPDHDALFAALFHALKPGGRLVAQCGGKGNIDAFRTLADEIAHSGPFAPYFRDWRGVWNYADAPEAKARLERAGFVDVHTWLEPRPTPLAEPRTFIAKVNLVRHLDMLPAALQDPYIDAVYERLEQPVVLDYVRLNMTARRPR